jgi:hypothetical protein
VTKAERVLVRWLTGLGATAMSISVGLVGLTSIDQTYSIIAGIIGVALTTLTTVVTTQAGGQAAGVRQ